MGAPRAREPPKSHNLTITATIYMDWSRGWHKVKHGNGFMIYTYEGGHGAYSLNDFALYNKGVVSLNCYVRNCGDIDEHEVKCSLRDYFRKYGKRIVVVERYGKKKIKCCRVEAHFPYPDNMPTDEVLDTWFKAIKSRANE